VTDAKPDPRARKDQSQLPLEDIRRQVVKFINKDDGTTRTVNVASCSSGVEVLERVLKKFGKWNTGASVSTDGESDEDGDKLEVDGWGVYAESDPDEDGKSPSEELSLTTSKTTLRGQPARNLPLPSGRKCDPGERTGATPCPQTTISKEDGGDLR
jgi:mitogen-activated protein kinase kinase kinase